MTRMILKVIEKTSQVITLYTVLLQVIDKIQFIFINAYQVLVIIIVCSVETDLGLIIQIVKFEYKYKRDTILNTINIL